MSAVSTPQAPLCELDEGFYFAQGMTARGFGDALSANPYTTIDLLKAEAWKTGWESFENPTDKQREAMRGLGLGRFLDS